MGFCFIPLLLLVSGFDAVQSRHFGYAKLEQESWHQHAESCSGAHQSPIAIESEKAVPLAIPALEMVGFNNLIPRPISVSNNGHSVDVRPGRRFAKVFGALLSGEYEVESIHFHWGKKNNRGSEHMINGMRYALEMHIVTRNLLYANISEAMHHHNGLAVLAFFFDVREKESIALRPILKDISMIKPEGARVFLSQTFTLGSLLPTELNFFYTYRGSLTTPPCSEAVTWMVFPNPQPVSYSQIKQFRQLSTEDEALVDNYRHIQRLGHRKIFVRRFPTEAESLQNVNYHDAKFWH